MSQKQQKKLKFPNFHHQLLNFHLKEVLKNYLNPSSEEETETTTTETAKPSTNTSTPSATTATKTADVEDAFDQLFNS